MPIQPIAAIEPPRWPEVARIDTPDLPGIQAPLRQRVFTTALRVWFHRGAAPTSEQVVCEQAEIDALLGDGFAQRLLMTAETSSLRRYAPELAALDGDPRPPTGDPVLDTRFSDIFLFEHTGVDLRTAVAAFQSSPAVAHVDVPSEGRSANAAASGAWPQLSAFEKAVYDVAYKMIEENEDYRYLNSGIKLLKAWDDLACGHGRSVFVVDSACTFDRDDWQPKRKLGAETTTSTAAVPDDHAKKVLAVLAGMFGGCVPLAGIAFSPITGQSVGTSRAKDSYAAIARVIHPGSKRLPGDVLNISQGLAVDIVVPERVHDRGDLLVLGLATSTLPLDMDDHYRRCFEELERVGVTVVLGAGNGLEALAVPLDLPLLETVAAIGRRNVGPLDLDKDLPDFPWGLKAKRTPTTSSAIVVGAGVRPDAKHQKWNADARTNRGSRIDCFVEMPPQHLKYDGVNALGWGTSFCAPVITGVATIVQELCERHYKRVLRPRALRALLSDPELGTRPDDGTAIGVMPDLSKLIAFLDPMKSSTEIVQAIRDRRAAIEKISGQSHNPYAAITRSPSKAIQEGDVFLAAPKRPRK